MDNFKRNIKQELEYIKKLAENCNNICNKNHIIDACDHIKEMCDDTFNGYVTENLELYKRLAKYEPHLR